MIGLHITTLKPTLVNKIILVSGQISFSDPTRKFISALGGGPNNFILDSNELTQIHGKKKRGNNCKTILEFQKTLW